MEIQKLRKENKELKKQIKGGEDNAVERTPEDLQKQAEMLMKAIRKNIEGQMVYKNGMKRKHLLGLPAHLFTVAIALLTSSFRDSQEAFSPSIPVMIGQLLQRLLVQVTYTITMCFADTVGLQA